MGYYIQTDDYKNKAAFIINEYGAEAIQREQAFELIDNEDGIVVVVDNGMFEAAGFAYSRRELEAFSEPNDPRRKTYLKMDRKRVEKLSGYDPGDRAETRL